MSIDTGQNLVFNANFPTPGIDQPSQQFRDNFQVIKTAIENLQSVSSDAGSIVTLTSTLSNIGALTFDISYTNNALILPINDPSLGSPIAGMIRYHTTTACLEFFDGTAWRQTIFKDSSGAVSLTTLTVTNRLTLGFTPTQASDATTKSYVDAAVAVVSNAVSSSNFASNAAVAAVQSDLNSEKVIRQDADTTLQNEINSINASLSNSTSSSNAVYSQVASLTQGLSDEANTRATADTSQQTTINSLSGLVNNAVAIAQDTSSELTQEITDRTNGDQYLNDLINAGVTQDSVTNAIAAEASTRAQADSDASNSITTIASNLTSEISRAEAAESNLAGFFGNAVQISGSTMTGDLTMNDANIVVDSGSLLLNSSEMIVDIGTVILTTAQWSVESGNVALSNSAQTIESGELDVNNSVVTFTDTDVTYTDSEQFMTNTPLLFYGGVSVAPVGINDTNVNLANTTLNLSDGSAMYLSNSALYLPNSDLTVDAGRYINLNKIPNTTGVGDGAFLTVDQNNFAYARMTPTVAAQVANSIIANGISNTNAMYEFSCLRIGTTNDPDNGDNGDSMALEPAADLWLNPGWAGTENATVNARTAYMPNASVYVGNATNYTVQISRATGDIKSNGIVKTGVYTTSTLPTAASAGAGARAFVTDATLAASGNFGATYVGGSTHSVPVWSDGTGWFLG